MTPAFVLAATGDTLLARRLSALGEPAFARVIDLLRDADAAFTNLETTIHDGDGHPAARSGGSWMVSPPYAADELRWAGLRLLARANNHALDWAVEGMRATTRLLDAHGLTHAGVGEDLAAARQPAYRDTPGGRVALVSATSTFAEWSRAGHARADIRGRPGLNPLRWAKVHLLGPQAFRAMQGIAAEVGIAAHDAGEAIRLFDTVFVPWQRTGVGVEALPQDVEGNLASVRAARARADWVIVSLHSHEDNGDVHQPAPFAVAFARACIDHGADAVLMHGRTCSAGSSSTRAGRSSTGWATSSTRPTWWSGCRPTCSNTSDCRPMPTTRRRSRASSALRRRAPRPRSPAAPRTSAAPATACWRSFATPAVRCGRSACIR
ncbi:MAG: hypothetical protein BroJett026_17440 [Betaproteobacteria bacterium]|nr:MAG: hypothetical protein BroJett026_17440 [Betaproteobacteria bacterium]